MDPKLEEFAKLLVSLVRDRAIQTSTQDLDPDARSPSARRWREVSNDPREVIPDVVDNTIAQLLGAIEQGLIKIKFVASDGTEVDLVQLESDLSGAYSVNWRGSYTRERAYDYHAALRAKFRAHFGN